MPKKKSIFPLHTTENTVQVLWAVVNESIIDKGLRSLRFPFVSMCDFYPWRNVNTIYVTRARCRP